MRRLLLLFALVACGGRKGDPPETIEPNPLGAGLRIRDVQAPGAKPPASPMANTTVYVSSAVVTAIDTFDETNDGRSRGTIYLQDLDRAGALGGISLFSPSFQPSNLRLFPGDVVDVRGQYVELHKIGSTVDFGTSFLPQFDRPNLVFRSETAKLPEPVEIDPADLFDFNKGRKWIGTLVVVKNLQVASGPVASKSGRVTAPISSSQGSPAISNELFDLKPGAFPDGAVLKSVTGLCTFFFTFKIAPRSQADIVL